MRNRYFFALVNITFIAGVLVSVQGFGEVNKGAIKEKDVNAFDKPNRSFNYQLRQRDIHSHILHMFPGTYLDSMAIVINLFNDSIRNELLKTKADSIGYFKDCLNNSLKDSILLTRLSKVSTGNEVEKVNLNGIFTARCMDESNSLPIDSVTMDVFSDNTLVASSMSDKLGIVQLHGIPSGNYSFVISRRGYVPVSLSHFKIATKGPSGSNFMLRKRNGYLMGLLIENVWIFLGGIAALLILTGVLAYYAGKRGIQKKATD